MTDGISRKSKIFWPRNLVKKWFSIKNKAEDFHKDHVVNGACDEDYRNNFPQREAFTSVKKSKTDWIGRGKIDLESSQVTDVNNYRVFVATWNVAGKSPPNHLNLEDWLHTSPPADIYVLGFQEIVPLNAGNVLGTEDEAPAKKWLDLIRRNLNNLPNGISGVHGTTRQNDSYRRSFQSLSRSMRVDGDDDDMIMPQPRLDRRFSVCDRVMFGNGSSEYRWDSSDGESDNAEEPMATSYYSPMYEDRNSQRGQSNSNYCLVASKQMVGIFLTVWVKRDLRDHVRNLKVSCVGRGLMGYLGNKGSISVSMSLHQTSFCFVCSHLTSGQKEGDELRRNSDVMEILRKTRFPRIHGTGDEYSPQTILEHDRIIWLGDLNYRIALTYRSAKALVEMRNWTDLLENDQLRIEQRQGRIFPGWNEGKIYFPPTYKYLSNSDRYTGESRHPKEKRRTPAWCDRILWYGKGLHQLSYVRGESRFSDHRPVYSVFLVEVESINRCRIKKSMSCSRARIEVEELLPYSQGFNQQQFY